MGVKSQFIDKAGQRFSHLLVVKRVGRDYKRRALFSCLCDCGRTTVIRTDRLPYRTSCANKACEFFQTLRVPRKIKPKSTPESIVRVIRFCACGSEIETRRNLRCRQCVLLGLHRRKREHKPNPNLFEERGNTIVLFVGKKTVTECFIDKVDYEQVRRHRWWALQRRKDRTAYCWTKIAGRKVSLHRFLCPQWPVIDHKDHNGLNNRRSNLREANGSQNLANVKKYRRGSSQYKGVHWSKKEQVWISQITPRGKRKLLGRFTSELEAAKAYDAAATVEFGEFASLNFSGRLGGIQSTA